MKILIPLIFIAMGCLFLLISTIFYPSITQSLLDLESRSSMSVPPWWDLTLVLKIVRVIFIIVGSFITVFGIGLFWMRMK